MTIKGCPICGKPPDISTQGSQIYIDCCVSMSLQKSDELTREERDTWDQRTLMYSSACEAKALAIILEEWNTRADIK